MRATSLHGSYTDRAYIKEIVDNYEREIILRNSGRMKRSNISLDASDGTTQMKERVSLCNTIANKITACVHNRHSFGEFTHKVIYYDARKKGCKIVVAEKSKFYNILFCEKNRSDILSLFHTDTCIDRLFKQIQDAPVIALKTELRDRIRKTASNILQINRTHRHCREINTTREFLRKITENLTKLDAVIADDYSGSCKTLSSYLNRLWNIIDNITLKRKWLNPLHQACEQNYVLLTQAKTLSQALLNDYLKQIHALDDLRRRNINAQKNLTSFPPKKKRHETILRILPKSPATSLHHLKRRKGQTENFIKPKRKRV